jgi:sec-independent protein translocase protein TatC
MFRAAVACIAVGKYYRKFTFRRESARFPRHISHRSMPLSRAQDDLFESSTMTFGQHLEELRRCLFKAILGLAIGCVLGFWLGDRVVLFIQKPVEDALKQYYEKDAAEKALSPEQEKLLREAGYTQPDDIARIRRIITEQHFTYEVVSIDPKFAFGQAPGAPLPTGDGLSMGLKKILILRPIADLPHIHMYGLSATEAFMIWMKASLLAGVVLSSPWIFYQIWQFVAAGLYPHERRYVHIFLPFSVILFLAGAGIAFFFAFDKVLDFLLRFNRSLHINPELRINEWMSFVLLLPLGFGASFQLPLVMLFLERIGLFTVKSYLASWRLAVLVIFILAMLLTPSPDPYTMLLMACPLTLLYFGGVVLCKVFPRAKSRTV